MVLLTPTPVQVFTLTKASGNHDCSEFNELSLEVHLVTENLKRVEIHTMVRLHETGSKERKKKKNFF